MEVNLKSGLTGPTNGIAASSDVGFQTRNPQDSPNIFRVKTPCRVVLLCDSHQQYASFSRRFARELTIESFTSGGKLLDALAAGYPADAIVASTDQGGWEVLRTVRSNAKLSQIPVIMLARELTPDLIEQARKQRADDVFDEDFTKGGLGPQAAIPAEKKVVRNGPVGAKHPPVPGEDAPVEAGHRHFPD